MEETADQNDWKKQRWAKKICARSFYQNFSATMLNNSLPTTMCDQQWLSTEEVTHTSRSVLVLRWSIKWINMIHSSPTQPQGNGHTWRTFDWFFCQIKHTTCLHRFQTSQNGYFCFVIVRDWSRKLAPPSQVIRCKTNTRLGHSRFPALFIVIISSLHLN